MLGDLVVVSKGKNYTHTGHRAQGTGQTGRQTQRLDCQRRTGLSDWRWRCAHLRCCKFEAGPNGRLSPSFPFPPQASFTLRRFPHKKKKKEEEGRVSQTKKKERKKRKKFFSPVCVCVFGGLFPIPSSFSGGYGRDRLFATCGAWRFPPLFFSFSSFCYCPLPLLPVHSSSSSSSPRVNFAHFSSSFIHHLFSSHPSAPFPSSSSSSFILASTHTHTHTHRGRFIFARWGGDKRHNDTTTRCWAVAFARGRIYDLGEGVSPDFDPRIEPNIVVIVESVHACTIHTHTVFFFLFFFL